MDINLPYRLMVYVLYYPEINEICFTLREQTALDIQNAVGKDHCRLTSFELTKEHDCGLIMLDYQESPSLNKLDIN